MLTSQHEIYQSPNVQLRTMKMQSETHISANTGFPYTLANTFAKSQRLEIVATWRAIKEEVTDEADSM